MTLSALETLKQAKLLPQAGEIQRVHVLLVDDDHNILRLCETYLQDARALGPTGVKVVVHGAVRGEQALEAARRLRNDGEEVAGALLDIVLPGAWDGIDTCLRLWEVARDVQCILMTGAGQHVEDAIEQRVPADLLPKCDYLGKPFTRFSLVQHLRRAIHSFCAHRQAEIRRGENIKLVLQLGALVEELGESDEDAAEENAPEENE